jgi:lysophospholipase L1-like esterase
MRKLINRRSFLVGAAALAAPVVLPAQAVITPNLRRGTKNMEAIVFFGDSMMIYPDSTATSGPDAYPWLIGAVRNFNNVYNEAVAGELASNGLARINNVLRHRPGAVAVGFGTNEPTAGGGAIDPNAYETTMRTIVSRLQAIGAKVTIITPALRQDGFNVDPYAARGVTIAGDTLGVVLFDLNARSHQWSGGQLSSYYLGDGVHFSATGASAVRDKAIEAGNLAAFRTV